MAGPVRGYCGAASAPRPATRPLPSLPSPRSGLRCWEQSLNPWKPQRLELRREEGAERHLADPEEGRGMFPSWRRKSLKHRISLPSSRSTGGLAPTSLQRCRNQGRRRMGSLGGAHRPWVGGEEMGNRGQGTVGSGLCEEVGVRGQGSGVRGGCWQSPWLWGWEVVFGRWGQKWRQVEFRREGSGAGQSGWWMWVGS